MMMKIDLDKAENNYFRGNLGAVYSPEKTLFRLWQPFAEKAFLRLYDANDELVSSLEMKRNKGVFELEIGGDLAGVMYDFAALENGEQREFSDCYSRLLDKTAKRGIVTDMRKNAPEGWEQDKPITADVPVIYELSVRDFSMDESADFKNRGKFSAFCEKNVKNKYGDPCGLEYIKSLGVTHIQLMPVFDFDSDGHEYNWGYNPRFFNAPSGYYSQENAVLELSELVLSAHKMGLGVIADVVYNHVYDAGNSSFERQLSGYFFRGDKEFSNGSGCGNEFASERNMARKFILDSVEFLAREYHLDGFRFDLMGLLDIETMRQIERSLRKINPSILLYGEGWTGGLSPLSEQLRAVQKNARMLSGIAFFNDSFRDAVRGSVFNVNDRGFISGDERKAEPILRAITGNYPDTFWTEDPAQTINYVECHDNHTLFDRLDIALKDTDACEIMRAEKMAAALLLLSQGTAFLHAGQEFLRTKNGSSNSYDLPDSINSIKWDMLYENRELVEYYRGLTAFRKRFLGELRGGEAEEINGGFVIKNNGFVIIINPTNENITQDLVQEHEVFIDEKSASDSPLYTSKRLCCAGYGVLTARCKTVEEGN
ncbi:MAG: type I pullulanase [Oscillospiraceae bacterium]|nr:type I pullulanase [Oscillospiraceae bacterium]